MQPTPLQHPFDSPRRPRLRKPHVTQRKLRQRPFAGPRNPWLIKSFAMQPTPLQLLLQMTSFGGNAFCEVDWNPTFKAQGQVYHRIGSLLPETATDSAFLQIYFIADYNQQADARMSIIPENDTGQDNHPRRDIIMRLQQMLHETNSYVCSFNYGLENKTSSDFIIVIDSDKRPQGEHERRYNAPTSNEVSVIVSGDQHNRRDIVIASRGSGLRRISETHRSYDALQYPLLFPHGEDGYNLGILQNESTVKSSVLQGFLRLPIDGT
ncbi:unnamed protein product [Acanthosepion pharaonis]|uniref:Helitron helicase-like domain-containing protein n=1 Tax=Acanthosepion pharaonis TaxID=158019 RepID=A0A812B0T7_ACAPH|nr:unnamed protein product [Sepia pharaonis]